MMPLPHLRYILSINLRHNACGDSCVYEDAEAQGGGGALHVFLDDCGNVIRQMRVVSNEVDNFDGAWSEGS